MHGSVGLWKATIQNHEEILNIKKIKTKLWIGISIEKLPHKRIFCELIISKIGKIDIITLELRNQTLDFKTFKFLVSSQKLKKIDMKMVFIEDEELNEITLDKIIKVLPKLDIFI
uniref:Uncharacterized protein n=1 Tax=Panagrolaimus sp. PS1159 TaxID=55785 RepID=A0AC35FJN1_9BILA